MELGGKRIVVVIGKGFQDQEVVVNRNIITPRVPGDLPAFNAEDYYRTVMMPGR